MSKKRFRNAKKGNVSNPPLFTTRKSIEEKVIGKRLSQYHKRVIIFWQTVLRLTKLIDDPFHLFDTAIGICTLEIQRWGKVNDSKKVNIWARPWVSMMQEYRSIIENMDESEHPHEIVIDGTIPLSMYKQSLDGYGIDAPKFE